MSLLDDTTLFNEIISLIKRIGTHITFYITNSRAPLNKISFNLLRKKTDPIFNEKGEILYSDNILIELLNNMQNIMKKKNLPFLTAKHIGQNKNIICIKQKNGTYKFYMDVKTYYRTNLDLFFPIKVGSFFPKFLATLIPVYAPKIYHSIPQHHEFFEVTVTPPIIQSNNPLEGCQLKYQKYDEFSVLSEELEKNILVAGTCSEAFLNSENFNQYYNKLQFWQKILLNIYSAYRDISSVITEKTSYLARLIVEKLPKKTPFSAKSQSFYETNYTRFTSQKLDQNNRT